MVQKWATRHVLLVSIYIVELSYSLFLEEHIYNTPNLGSMDDNFYLENYKQEWTGMQDRWCKKKYYFHVGIERKEKMKQFLHIIYMDEHTPPSISVSHAWAHAPWWSHNWIPIPFVVGFDCPAVAKVRNHLRWLGVIRRPFWFWCSTWIFGRPSWDVGKLLVFAPKLFSSAYGAPFLGLFDATESKILLSRISSG